MYVVGMNILKNVRIAYKKHNERNLYYLWKLTENFDMVSLQYTTSL